MLTDQIDDAVRLLRSTPHEYRYTIESLVALQGFLDDVRWGLGYDAGRLRWRFGGYLTGDTTVILWLDHGEARESPAQFA